MFYCIFYQLLCINIIIIKLHKSLLCISLLFKIDKFSDELFNNNFISIANIQHNTIISVNTKYK